ncbi:toprim domain-containing protein, partial [uncultured Megasphaera sp.]
MTTLYIAEKPDIGKAIATYLWPDGSAKREKNYIEKGDTIVAWAAGHILRQAMPEEYDPEYKSWNHYEIFPKDWKLLPSADKKDLLSGLGKLLKKADVVIHAGDPDREGQLLIDEILKYYNYHGKVKRLLINAKDDVSMKRAFDSIEDNEKYQPLYEAGLARERADWLVGINLSRA